jgi:hypothetical protein
MPTNLYFFLSLMKAKGTRLTITATDLELSIRTSCEVKIKKEGAGTQGTDNYTHTFTDDEWSAAEKLGELFGTGWPEIDTGKVVSFPNLSRKEEGLAIGDSQALVNQ